MGQIIIGLEVEGHFEYLMSEAFRDIPTDGTLLTEESNSVPLSFPDSKRTKIPCPSSVCDNCLASWHELHPGIFLQSSSLCLMSTHVVIGELYLCASCYLYKQLAGKNRIHSGSLSGQFFVRDNQWEMKRGHPRKGTRFNNPEGKETRSTAAFRVRRA